MELALAIVQHFNPWLAFALIGVGAGIALTKVNRRWADTNDRHALREHERKMFELETERKVKLDPLRTPEKFNGPKLEHRTTERDEG